MAYKVKYFMEFDTIISEARVRVEFHKKDYKLSKAHRLLGVGTSPLTINYQGDDTLRSAEITIQFVVTNKKLHGLKNFWTATEKDWKILIYVNDAIFLESFLLVTDHSTEPMTDDNYILTLKATDGLVLLDSVDFKTTELYGPFENVAAIEVSNDYLNRRYKMAELLALGFSKTDLASGINEFTNVFEEDMVTSNSMYQQAKIHLKRLKGSGNFVKTRDVLEMILETFGQIAFQKSGNWVITSIPELSKSIQKGRALNIVDGSQTGLIQQNKNEILSHASKLSRFYFVNANGIRWYVAPLRKIVAKIDYKDTISVLNNGNFSSYVQNTNTFFEWEKIGNINYSRTVIEGYGNVLKFDILLDSSQIDRGWLQSPVVNLPPKSSITFKILVKRNPFDTFGDVVDNVEVRLLLVSDTKTYSFITGGGGNVDSRELKNGIIRKTTTALLRSDITNQNPQSQVHFFNLDKDERINEDEFVEHFFTVDKNVIPLETASTLTVSIRSGNTNFVQYVSLVELNIIELDATVKGEYIELTNDEESKVETKDIKLNLQDDPFLYASHGIINTNNNLPTQAWRRLGREEGKSLGELTAEMIFNNAINHRPYFQTDFKIRTAPYNYGDTFSYENYKYLPQDYEYDVKNDEVKAKIIRPIGDCEYNHKAEFWDIPNTGDEILTLTKKYVIDSSACADIVEVEPFGAFFEFNGLVVEEDLWREAENVGTDIVVLPYGQFFDFGGLVVEEDLWREAETQGTDLSTVNLGAFFEFGFAVNENLWREAQGAGLEMNYELPYGQFFEFELPLTAWNEAENAGRNPDFSNEDFSSDFDIIE